MSSLPLLLWLPVHEPLEPLELPLLPLQVALPLAS
jgi:hypothetical protein